MSTLSKINQAAKRLHRWQTRTDHWYSQQSIDYWTEHTERVLVKAIADHLIEKRKQMVKKGLLEE